MILLSITKALFPTKRRKSMSNVITILRNSRIYVLYTQKKLIQAVEVSKTYET